MSAKDFEAKMLYLLKDRPDLTQDKDVRALIDYAVKQVTREQKKYETDKDFNENWNAFIFMFNQVTDRNIKPETDNPKAKRQLSALMKSHSMKELEHAVKAALKYAKSGNWFNNLTPEYITRPDSFAKWIIVPVVESQKVDNANSKYF